jgi:hypothetical protein
MIHDPQARLDYTWDWTAWLGAGETILNASIALAPEGALTLIPPLEIDGGRVTVWLAGGAFQFLFGDFLLERAHLFEKRFGVDRFEDAAGEDGAEVRILGLVEGLPHRGGRGRQL